MAKNRSTRALSPKMLGGPLLSVASQALGLVQLLLLMWRVGPGELTDAYLFMFTLGMLPAQILIAGIALPALLNRNGLVAGTAKLLRLGTPFLSMGSVGIGYAWILCTGRTGAWLIPIALVLSLNAIIQSAVWFRAIVAEAAGEPRWTVSMALPANLMAVLSLSVQFSAPEQQMIAMCWALVVGNSLLVGLMYLRRVGASAIANLPSRDSRSYNRSNTWFLLRSSAGYGSIAVLQALAVLLPPAALTVLAVVSKIVTSVTGSFVNAVLPRLINSQTNSIRGAQVFLAWMISLTLAVGTVGSIIIIFWDATFAAPAIAASLWLAAAVASPVAQRAAYRFLTASASKVAIVCAPLVSTIAVFLSGVPNFSVVTLICAYGMTDALISAILLHRLQLKIPSLICFGLCFLLALLSLWSVVTPN